MTPAFWWQVAITLVSAGAVIATLKVDMGWVKRQLKDHIEQDETRFMYMLEKIGKD